MVLKMCLNISFEERENFYQAKKKKKKERVLSIVIYNNVFFKINR